MLGKYSHTIDPKGRLFVPARLREKLGECFYATISLTDRCVKLYTEERWQAILEKYKTLPMQHQATFRYVFAHTYRVEPDKQGRFLLPQDLRIYGQLSPEVSIIGHGDHVEIWDAAAFEAKEKEELSPEKLAEFVRELNF